MSDLKLTIENLFENSFHKRQDPVDERGVEAIRQAIKLLDSGEEKICTCENGEWITHQWLKQAILLYFKIQSMRVMNVGEMSFVDKIPLKKWSGHEGVRVVPHALVREGAHVASGAILMPSYVNIGAHVGSGSMIDTWATVGSCAQVGTQVHISGGVGIGGVLEPIQANPVIIENNVFVGSRCIIVEGAIIEEGAVLGAGVTITASTQIIDVTNKKEVVYKGRVPKNAVVIPGTRTKDFTAGAYGVPAALIIGQRSENTDKKTSLTEALREHNVSV